MILRDLTSSVIVAENNIVCLPRGHSRISSSIWSLKCSSSILKCYMYVYTFLYLEGSYMACVSLDTVKKAKNYIKELK